MARSEDKPGPKVVVITGANGGIGAALSRAYAAPSVHLGLLGRNEETLAGVAADCRRKGASVETLVADVTGPAVIDLLLEFDARHSIDLLIAGAGVTSGIPSPNNMEPWDTAEAALLTNFVGGVRTIAPVAARMAERGRGQIAAIGSLAALTPLPFSPAYSAAKAGLTVYVRALRRLLAARGVRFTVVSIGYVDTAMSRKLTGSKRFMITPERAARVIRKGLERNRAHLAYPVVLATGIRVLNLLPEPLVRLILPAFAFTISGWEAGGGAP
ncbi:MAG: SDR family NAD(P)-dependent oxidoreductase [Parvibaculaceae bacterium]